MTETPDYAAGVEGLAELIRQGEAEVDKVAAALEAEGKRADRSFEISVIEVRLESLREAWQVVTGQEWPEPPPRPLPHVVLPDGVVVCLVEYGVSSVRLARFHMREAEHAPADGSRPRGEGRWRQYTGPVPLRLLVEADPEVCKYCSVGFADWRSLPRTLA